MRRSMRSRFVASGAILAVGIAIGWFAATRRGSPSATASSVQQTAGTRVPHPQDEGRLAKARRVPVPKFDPSYLRRSLREEMQPDKEPKPVSLAPTQNRLYETLKLPPAQEAKLRSILREQKIR